jgi:ABC-type branched-subunit amino acid transport system ATPase component
MIEVRKLVKRFGLKTVLRGLDFHVEPGEFVAILGPNGAGKTTFLDALGGLVAATGEVVFDGRPLAGPAHTRARRGIARTFQGLDLYDQLTVAENVQIGRNISAEHGDDGRIASLLAGFGLEDDAETFVGELTQGQRQLVSIARSLAGRPDLLLLDEPAAGLDTTESAWLGTHLESIRDGGTSILLVEHDMALVSAVCDDIYVLDFGQIIARGTPAEIHTSAAVATAYLGTTRQAGSVR